MPPELTPFNLPDALTVTGKRDASTLATQSLYLLNNDFIVKQSASFASRLISQTKDDATRLQQAYRQALTRKPTNSETQRDLNWLHEMDLTLVSEHPDTIKREKIIWAAFCQALLASNELRYVD